MAMRVVCAPDSFKESMTALAAAQALASGVRRVVPDAECTVIPMADGGEGTVTSLADALDGSLVTVTVTDALGRPVGAEYCLVAERGLAVIEMASAAGLELIPPGSRDVRRASSYGVGMLIRDALDRGARRFLIGLGGSATNDAGTGMLAALGVRFLDAEGRELPPGGAALAGLAALDVAGLDPRLAGCAFDIACDVDNPLLGPRGASAVFGPQKGADPAAVAELDAALARWAEVVEASLAVSVRDLPGAGAAGGLGAAMAAFLPARLRRGVEIVAEAVDLRARIRGADLVFTGEGSLDAQTLSGKTPWGVLEAARAEGVPVVMFAGRISADAAVLHQHGVTALVPIVRCVQSLDEALAAGPDNLAAAAELATRLLVCDVG